MVWAQLSLSHAGEHAAAPLKHTDTSVSTESAWARRMQRPNFPKPSTPTRAAFYSERLSRLDLILHVPD
jgi:hypothetical protein